MELERKRRRNKRVRQVKRIRMLLVAGGLVLAVMLAVIFVGKLKNWVEVRAASAEEKNLGGEVQKLTVGAIGACIFGDVKGADKEDSFAEKYEEEGPGYFFKNAQYELCKNDLNIANYIGDMSEDREAFKKHPIKGKKEYAQIFQSSPVGFLNMANNRTKDFGQEGYYDTALALNDGGTVTFGHERVILTNIEGIRIGFIGIDTLDESKDMEELLDKNIERAKGAGAQLTIVCINWGKKDSEEPSEGQRSWAHKAIDAGADLVLGYHPDRVQEVEAYEGRYIIYSLGVFCNGAEKKPEVWDGVIYRQTFGFLDGKLAKVWEPEQIPCRISSKFRKNNFQPEVK